MLPDLINAINSGDNNKAKELINQLTPEQLKVTAAYTQMPLHLAATKNNLEIINVLLAKGIDVNVLDHSHCTPLHSASQNARTQDAIKLLLEKGAKLEALDHLSLTPLMYAVTKEIAETFIACGAQVGIVTKNNETALWRAAVLNREEVVKTLIANGADINYKSPKQNNQTALIYTVNIFDDYQTAKQLIAAGADLSIKDNQGKTALDYAISQNRPNSIKWLKTGELVDKMLAGADVTAVDPCLSEQEIQQLFLGRINSIVKKSGVKIGCNLDKYKGVLPDDLLKLANDKIAEIKYAANPALNGKLIEEVMAKIAEGNDRISSEAGETILLLGNTGSGKSTLAHIMADRDLQAINDEQTGRLVIDALKPLDSIKISHNKISETKIPNKCVTTSKVVVWDCPGFNDTDVTQEIANSFYIRKLYNQHSKMKFVLVAYEGDLTGNRGMAFTTLVQQFCSGFSDVSKVKDSVELVISAVSPGRQMKHIENDINQIITQNTSLSKEVQEMLGYLKGNVKLFHQPIKEGELLKGNLAFDIEKTGKYVDSKEGMGKFTLSPKAQEYCSELLKMSFSNLEQMATTLVQACGNPSAFNQTSGNNGVLDKRYELIKSWLPTQANYLRGQEPKQHHRDEYFTREKQLIKLSALVKQVDKVGNGVGRLDVVTKLIEKLFNVYEEYVVISDEKNLGPNEVKLKEKLQHFAYSTQQLKEYCKLFASLLYNQSEQDLNLTMLADKLTSDVKHCSQLLSAELKKAVLSLSIGEGSTDIGYFQQALKILSLESGDAGVVKKKAVCFKAIGTIKKKEGKLDEALKYYYKALEHDKTLVGAYEEVAEMCVKENKLKDAAKFYKALGNVQKLQDCYKQLVSADKYNAKLLEEYADALAESGLTDKALVYYVKANGLTKEIIAKKALCAKTIKVMAPEFKAAKIKEFEDQAAKGEFYKFDQLDLKPFAANIDEAVLMGNVDLGVDLV